ncbi:MAG: hypothetical protein NXI32_22890 [bacterium]|nr:hypothetical protein [bacterium]
MSGIFTLASFHRLNPETEYSNEELRFGLKAAQAIAERLSGLAFGSEVISSTEASDVFTIEIAGGRYEVGDSVWLFGTGTDNNPYTVTDCGTLECGTDFIKVATTDALAALTRVLPVKVYETRARSGKVYAHPAPVFSIISVKTRADENTLWADTGVEPLEATEYETFESVGIKAGIRLRQKAVPVATFGGRELIRRKYAAGRQSVRLEYVAGFYAQVPMDLQLAASMLVTGIMESKEGGTFASENLDYYSYQHLSMDQMAALPYAAVATLSRYARLF